MRCAAEYQQQTKGTYRLSQFITSDPLPRISHAKSQRRKENLLETRQRFAPLRLCAFA